MEQSGDPGRLIDLARERGVISAADAEELGIDRLWLARLAARGRLDRVARGRYRHADSQVSEHHTLVLASSLAPSAVICLLSALQYHEIGIQSPAEVWIALKRGSWRPDAPYPPLRVAHLSDESFAVGVEQHVIEGIPVPIYSVAKTVADCFKFRHRIGLDVALEALTDAWRQRKLTLADLNRFAAMDRVQRIIRPYIETIIR